MKGYFLFFLVAFTASFLSSEMTFLGNSECSSSLSVISLAFFDFLGI